MYLLWAVSLGNMRRMYPYAWLNFVFRREKTALYGQHNKSCFAMNYGCQAGGENIIFCENEENYTCCALREERLFKVS